MNAIGSRNNSFTSESIIELTEEQEVTAVKTLALTEANGFFRKDPDLPIYIFNKKFLVKVVGDGERLISRIFSGGSFSKSRSSSSKKTSLAPTHEKN